MSAYPATGLLAAAVEFGLNAALAGSNSAHADRKRLMGKAIALEVRELPVRLYFLPAAEKISVVTDHAGPVDITVKAPTSALLSAALKRGESVPKGIEINGDAETGQVFSRLLKQAELDWEELLSHYVGDVAARQIGNVARSFLAWGADTAKRLGQDLSEYLQYEAMHLPPRREVEGFLNSVDKLRDDAERFAARLERASLKAKRA